MDPVSQGAFGGAFALILSSRKKIFAATLVGIIAGLSPDLDTLIRSSDDPLLHLEYHRQITHSLFFIPIGALVVTIFCRIFFFKKLSFSENYIFAFLGYATHGLLDTCTSYGTQLLWPFSNERFAWNNISIIDPFLTLPILILIIFTVIFKNKIYNVITITWIFIYLGFGFFQNYEATKSGIKLAKFRKHNFESLTVKPSIGNLFLWKIVYLYNGEYFVDAVNLIGKPKFCFGTKITKLEVGKHFEKLHSSSKQFNDIKRFDWFSQGYLGYDSKKEIITDVRYSLIPNQVDGLWGIKINKDPSYQGHVKWVVNRSDLKNKWTKFSNMLIGSECKELTK